jgi:hypothetical protein
MQVQATSTQNSVNTIVSSNESEKETTFEVNGSSDTYESVEDIIKKYRERLGLNGNFSIDIISQQKQDYLSRHEEEFKEEYPLYEKYKDIFTPEYSNYTKEKADAILKELYAQFPTFRDISHKAHYGGTQQDRELYNEMFMDYQAYRSYLQEKYDLEISNSSPFLSQSPEGMKAYNLAIYDQLESGVSLNEAKARAREMSTRFGSTQAFLYATNLMRGYPENMEELVAEMRSYETDYSQQIDLREYGFDHNFDYPDYFRKFFSDQQGVQARIMYDVDLYTFLTQNEDKVDQKIDELRQKNKKWPELYLHSDEFAIELKKQFQHEYEVAMYAKSFYERYSEQIFSNTSIHSTQKTLEHKAQTIKNKIDLASNSQTKKETVAKVSA